jgi:hypothetical protein
MSPKTPPKKIAEASPYASTFKNSRLPTHSRDVPEYVAFWSTRRLNLFMTLAIDIFILAQHYAFRHLLAVRYIPLQQSKFRGALEALAVMGPPQFMWDISSTPPRPDWPSVRDVCISIVKTLVAISINFAPEAIRSRIPGIFYLVVCRLINAADGAYLLMLQLYQVKLAEDYHDYPWFTGKTAPKQPARVPLIPSLAVAGSYMASGLILARALLFCAGQLGAFFSKSVPAGRKTEMLISAEYAVKVLFFLNSLLSATPFLSSVRISIWFGCFVLLLTRRLAGMADAGIYRDYTAHDLVPSMVAQVQVERVAGSLPDVQHRDLSIPAAHGRHDDLVW